MLNRGLLNISSIRWPEMGVFWRVSLYEECLSSQTVVLKPQLSHPLQLQLSFQILLLRLACRSLL